jgi:hypothetical protein
MRKHPLYPVWIGLRRRSRDRRSSDYGLHLYDPWYESAKAFVTDVEALIGPRPDGHVLGRVKDDEPYEPGNIRWVTTEEHRRNRRSVRYLLERIGELERENKRLHAEMAGLRVEVDMYREYSR